MTVTITRHQFARLERVELDLIASTIERNRDRVRTISGMLLSLAAILIPSCTAFVLFVAQNAKSQRFTLTLFVLSVVSFLLSAVLAILSSFLRTEYAIIDKPRFVADLLQVYNSELRLLRIASVIVILGLSFLTAATTSFLIQGD